MSYRYAVLGAGRQGRAAAFDLARFGDASSVRIFDRDPAQVKDALSLLEPLCPGKISGATLDVENEGDVLDALKDVDGVLSAVPYFLNAGLCKLALQAKTHFADLGGNTGVVKEQLLLHEEAKAQGVSVCPDCGLAPGLSNLIAARALAELPDVNSVRIYCGGLPQKPEGPLNYQLVFAVEGLINEYSGKAVVIRQGAIEEIETLGESERVIFAEPLGELEACVTSGGTSTAPESFSGRLADYEYKTLRYPGHFEKFRLFRELGFLSPIPTIVRGEKVVPRELFQRLLEAALSKHEARDLVVLRVVCTAADGGGRIYEIIDYYDEQTGFSAMERMTGFPAAAVLFLQVRGDIAAGARPIELAVPSSVYFTELQRRGLMLEQRPL